MEHVRTFLCAIVIGLALGRPGSITRLTSRHNQTQLDQETDHVAIDRGRKEYVKNDMGFDRVSYKKIFGKDPKKAIPSRARRSAIVSNTSMHWPEGRVPIEMNLTGWTKDERSDLLNVIAFFEEETCISFENRTENDTNWVMLEDCDYWDTGCWSSLGMTGGKQHVCLGEGCKYPGTYLHEFGHMLGLIHEHQRDDRDDFIRINFTNVEEGTDDQFDKTLPGVLNKTEYDYKDPMHYERTAFSKDVEKPLYTISAVDQSKNSLIQNTDYSLFNYTTVKLLNEAYNCSSSCKRSTGCAGGFINKKCKCVTPRVFKASQCKDWDKLCPHVASIYCDDDDLGQYMQTFCRRSCKACDKQ